MSRCRSCKKPLRWARTLADKRLPLDPTPDPATGNVLIVDGIATVLSGDTLDVARAAGAVLFVPHWATCSEPDRFRQRGQEALIDPS